MPKLKTHHWAGMTLQHEEPVRRRAGRCYGWPKNLLHFHGIENSILDLAATIRPHLAIVDGIVGMEGDGPIMGTPRPVGACDGDRPGRRGRDVRARHGSRSPSGSLDLSMAGEFLGHVDASRIDVRGDGLQRFVTPFKLIEAAWQACALSGTAHFLAPLLEGSGPWGFRIVGTDHAGDPHGPAFDSPTRTRVCSVATTCPRAMPW